MSIKIENYEVTGWEHAIRGMRNPKNSWEKSDSEYRLDVMESDPNIFEHHIKLGPNDHDLMMRLRNAGTDHRKFMRMITVYVDITAPLYWLKEFDTYKIGTVANSCSTMHKIHEKEFTLEDFSCEKLLTKGDPRFDSVNKYCTENNIAGYVYGPLDDLKYDIEKLNIYRQMYNQTKDKVWWEQMIQRLPSSYNQKRTIMLNYEVLANIYPSRRRHKLDEWHVLCDWIESLPYAEIITGGKKDGEEKL